MKVGKGKIIYLSLHCHHQNDNCIRMGSDESHFNVSLIVRDKVTRQCPQTQNVFEEKGRPKRNRAGAFLLNIIRGYELKNERAFKYPKTTVRLTSTTL